MQIVLKLIDVIGTIQKVLVDDKAEDAARRNQMVEDMIEDPTPQEETYKDNFVESIQGSLTQLPYASTYTKYIMRQYRPDPSVFTRIDVSLSCKPVNEGCAHFSCSTPPSTPNSSVTSGERTSISINIIPTTKAGTIDLGIQDDVKTFTYCNYPSYSVLIDWNGDVFLCPQDWQRRRAMGNMMQEKIFEIWTGKIIEKYRKKLLEGKRCYSPCTLCNAEGTVLGQNHANAWKKIYKIT